MTFFGFILGAGIGWLTSVHGTRHGWPFWRSLVVAQCYAIPALVLCHFVAWLAKGAP